MCMATTRQRVNLTLTEMEQRLLEAIVTAGTPEHEAFARHLSAHGTYTWAEARAPGLADVVHVVLRMGLERLELESAEASYAAEAAAQAETDRASTAARRRRLGASAARTRR